MHCRASLREQIEAFPVAMGRLADLGANQTRAESCHVQLQVEWIEIDLAGAKSLR